MSTIRNMMIFTLLLVLLISGCGQSNISPQLDLNNPPLVLPPPLTPTQLMDNFQTIYAEMDMSNYRDLVDDRFLFFFNSDGDFWTREEDLISTDNMFSGESRFNSAGEHTVALNEISVDYFTVVDTWEPVSETHSHFGSLGNVQQALYDVRIVLYHDGGTVTIETDQMFYALPLTIDGVTTWTLIGQADGANKANEDMTWTNIKWLFR